MPRFGLRRTSGTSFLNTSTPLLSRDRARTVGSSTTNPSSLPECTYPGHSVSTLTVVVDTTILTTRCFTAEPGLWFLPETAGKKILFDAGYPVIFLANAGKRGLDLRNPDGVVLSHGDLDHSRG